jgi:hypothetical protein
MRGRIIIKEHAKAQKKEIQSKETEAFGCEIFHMVYASVRMSHLTRWTFHACIHSFILLEE